MDRLNYPPVPARTFDFPVATSIAIAIIFVVILLIASNRFDFTRGPLTISILIVMLFIGVTSAAMLYNIPQDETTGAVIGALVLAVGGVITYWLSPKNKDGE